MEKILVPTDFSAAADNAARYALRLAIGIKANLKLCNAMKIPAEASMALQVAWPLEDYSSIKKDVTEDLKLLSKKLTHEEDAETGPLSYHPLIEFVSEVGSVVNMINKQAGEQEMNLVVMGMSGAGGMSRMFLGSNSREMIEKSSSTVLLVPSGAKFKGVKKIAFATDLNTDDVNVIYSLAVLARPFDAEILITHITDETFDNAERQHKLDFFMNEIICKANYANISYRHVQSIDVEHGLDWLTENGKIDILAMVHRPYNFFHNLLKGSCTQKMARRIDIPLLVFPTTKQSVFTPDSCGN